MYKKFFGFKERPFQLVPNPAYLFMSRSHEEALAHLTYAISEGDGFVEVIGEVGTGKTTLCRAFIESMDEKTEVAYIFNPKLDSMQLLKAINDEFGISSAADNTKDLIDTLNAFLMARKAEGGKVVLIVDEAHNLSKEVLEQLRLLSNLETTTSKLLQIILVGQPELGDMLDSHDLRQLGQRITLSCHLLPLTFRETRDYIQHRIQVASQRSGCRFTTAAIKVIYRYAGGIPRLINIACDRALLTAYGLNHHKITGGIARVSVRELAGRGDVRRFGLYSKNPATMFFALGSLVLAFVILYQSEGFNRLFGKGGDKEAGQAQIAGAEQAQRELAPGSQLFEAGSEPEGAPAGAALQDRPAGDAAGSGGQEAKALEPAPNSGQDLERVLKAMDAAASRRMALKVALQMWNQGSVINDFPDYMEDDWAFFRSGARQNGLLIHRIDADLELVRTVNLPAILAFKVPGRRDQRYLTVTRLRDRVVMLDCGADLGEVVVKPEDLAPLWSGVAYIPWKNFLEYRGTIPRNAPRESVMTLKMLLQDIGFTGIEVTPYYDQRTREAIEEFQARHALEVDGVVGPLTKIVLYNELKSLEIPHILSP